MSRSLRVIGVVASITVILPLFWVSRTRPAKPTGRESVGAAIHSALSNPVAFTKARVTGGVGAVLRADLATGLPMVQQLMAGSPAERAGLRPGDLILQVDGAATKGKSLARTVEDIRGFSAGSVKLTVQRNGTNVECIIHRTSWKSLQGLPLSTNLP